MNEREDFFAPNEPENEPEKLEEVAAQESVDSIAEKYSAEPIEVEAEPVAEVAEAAEQPAAVPEQSPIQADGSYHYAYSQPQPPVQQWQPSYNYSQPPYQPQEDKKKKNKKGRKVFCILLAAVLIIAAIAIPVSLNKSSKDGVNSGLLAEQTTVNADAPELELNKTPVKDTNSSSDILSAEEIYEKVAASNVAVMVYADDSLYTEGTGIVMGEDKSGEYTYIITCAHVISDSGIEAVIQLEDGKRYDADIVGFDARTDIGVLRITAKGLTAAEFGDSDALKVGSTVYAIGNPGGSALFGTFTDGKISAIGRNITSSIGYDMVCIQHNAAISPGNSGGMLVNEYGQVIGINSSKIAATDYEGISFAIPITQAQDIINKVIAYGYVPGRAKLGISYVENDSSSISSIYSMAVQMKGLPSGSLVIYSIDENSALKNTEAQAGDMIIAVNGKDLDKADVLLETIEDSSVGDVLTLKLFRITVSGGRYQTSELEVKATLIEETNQTQQEQTTAGVYGNDGSSGSYGSYGFNFGF